MAAGTPDARAAMAMFVVSEVHPFSDGNGRTARLAMNHALSAEGRVRIVIPTVFREDYLLALKALSRNGEPAPYSRMLSRAAAFSHGLRYDSEHDCFAQLRRSNALESPETAQLRFAS
jgi:Fic family protein